jgi:hypothetical protein
MPSQKIGIKEVGKLADALTQVITQRNDLTKNDKEMLRKIRDELNDFLSGKLGGDKDG